MSIFYWRELNNTPITPGVYAWYYKPEINLCDQNKIIEDINRLKMEGNKQEAMHAVRDFLHNNIFRFFYEEPYKVEMKGPLKQKYEGEIEHKFNVSDTLVERIVNDPQRFSTIKRVLELSVPDFASPIYIGMSERLRTRLLQHKELIERYASQVSPFRESNVSDGDQRDHSFAHAIRVRNITPTRLFVIIHELSDLDDSYIDIENILNRIHYPLLGRN